MRGPWPPWPLPFLRLWCSRNLLHFSTKEVIYMHHAIRGIKTNEAQFRSPCKFQPSGEWWFLVGVWPPSSHPPVVLHTDVGTSETLWVKGAEAKTRHCWWRSGEGIPTFQWHHEAVMKTASDFCYVFSHYFYCDIDPCMAKTLVIEILVFMYDEKDVLLENIVGAEYIICIHWLKIVGRLHPLHLWFLRLWYCKGPFRIKVGTLKKGPFRQGPFFWTSCPPVRNLWRRPWTYYLQPTTYNLRYQWGWRHNCIACKWLTLKNRWPQTWPNLTYKPSTYHLKTYHLQPTDHPVWSVNVTPAPPIPNLLPTTYNMNMSPTTCHLQPTIYNLPPTTY